MGNLISRPSCLGQKSKHVRSDEAFLKECYQRRREWQPPEQHGEAKPDVDVKDKASEDANKDKEVENDKEAQEIEYSREEGARTPISDKPLRSSPASTIRSTSTLDNAWHSSPSPIKTSRNGTLTRRTMPPEYARSPLAHSDKSAAERRASFQRRDSREGSPWSWKTLASREVTEVTEVTETIVTEIVEVTEYPSGQKGGDPIVTRTVRVLNGAAEQLAEVDKNTNFSNMTNLTRLHFILSPSHLNLKFSYILTKTPSQKRNVLSMKLLWVFLKTGISWNTSCGLSLFCSSKAMDTQAQTRIPAWIDGRYVFTL